MLVSNDIPPSMNTSMPYLHMTIGFVPLSNSLSLWAPLTPSLLELGIWHRQHVPPTNKPEMFTSCDQKCTDKVACVFLKGTHRGGFMQGNGF